MPLDVIMPALGMAQESGIIVAWHKKPGEAVAEGDVLFEVETDKATMEVEAAGAGFLTGVVAAEGDDIPVGQVIAKITATADEDAGAAPAAKNDNAGETQKAAAAPEAPAGDEELPEGHNVIMPVLGMAQDSGLLVAWHVAPGAKVAEGDVLFEVETDKSTMEVAAEKGGYVAALLAEEDEDIPTGQVIAILTEAEPKNPIRRSAGGAKAAPAPAQEEAPEEEPKAEAKAPAPKAAPKAAPAPRPAKRAAGGRILASPKARRLALEAGIDLADVLASGAVEPLRAEDITSFTPSSGGGRILTAEVDGAAYAAFAGWASKEAGLTDEGAILAGLAAPGLGQDEAVIRVERKGEAATYHVAGAALSGVTPVDGGHADIVIRDLRGQRVASAAFGGGGTSVSIGERGGRLVLTLETGSRAAPEDAIHLISELAGRLEEPLRHLL